MVKYSIGYILQVFFIMFSCVKEAGRVGGEGGKSGAKRLTNWL